MRVAGGLLGGAWLTHLTADLGNGRFDGAWLAQSFENLTPEKAIWEKYAHLFASVDTEQERFLEFERWWNGFYFLSREEILAIVENLFIGDQLEQGQFRICEGCWADLRRIKNRLAALGGLDRLVFTGGIGANAPVVPKVCTGLKHLDIVLDDERNANGARLISADASRIAIEAFPTDEELMIARHVQHVPAAQPAAQGA